MSVQVYYCILQSLGIILGWIFIYLLYQYIIPRLNNYDDDLGDLLFCSTSVLAIGLVIFTIEYFTGILPEVLIKTGYLIK